MELEMKFSPLRQQYGEYPAGEAEKDDRPLLKSDSSVQYTSVEQIEKTFSAFVRNDTYGTLGIDEISLRQKFLLGFALVTLVPIRLIVGMSVLILYYLICRICTLFSVPNREDDQEDYAHMVGWRRSVIVYCGRILSRAILFTMGFYWIHESYRFPLVESQHNNEDETDVKLEVSERPGTIISNHVSYLDILYHMSSSFPSFVAKISVERLPLVGLISKCLGCIYVQRESKSSDFKGVSGIVTERILTAYQNKDAPMMLLFPEGTTSNGNFLLPFKTGAFLPKVPVLPVILKYPYQRFSPAWESISGVRHVILLLCQFVNHMEVIHLPVYCPSKQEKEDPKLYANNVRSFMATEGNLTLSNLGLAEKRTYMAALNGNGLPNDLRPKAD